MNYRLIIKLFLVAFICPMFLTACDTKVGIAEPTIKEWGYVNATLEWVKVKNADGYEIERSILEESNFTVIDKTDLLTYEDSSLDQNSVYYYKVRAYKEKDGEYSYGEYSETISIKTNKVAVPILSNWGTSYTTADLSWTAVQGASSYVVYKGNLDSNILNFYTTVFSTSIKVADLEPASMYTFIVVAQVKADSRVISSDNSNAVYLNTKFMSGVTSLNLTSSASSIYANWFAVDGVDGYEVYVSTDYSSCISKGNLVMKTTFTSVTLTGLESGTHYYVAVRPYVKSSSKTYYPQYNSSRSVYTQR